MKKIALLGAGGKMGLRLSANLKGSEFEIMHVEKLPEARQRLKEINGIDCTDMDAALDKADIILMAVPDNLIGVIAHSFIDQVHPGTAIIMLDAAAPHAGDLPERKDVTYFVSHPCHPPLFPEEPDVEGHGDFFGGVQAKQHIVCALMQGPEEHYALCEKVAKIIYGPVMRSHRVTVEHIAILEPALSETVGATMAYALREATDKAIEKGVPKQAAIDFMLGHLNIELALTFDQFEGKFSDGAIKAIEEAKPIIFQPGWLDKIFSDDAIKKSVKSITKH